MTETTDRDVDKDQRLTPDREMRIYLNPDQREALAKSISVGIETEDEKEAIQQVYRALLESSDADPGEVLG